MFNQSRKFLFLTSPICSVLLFALILTSLIISHHSSSKEGIVYCPLQKKWVKTVDESKIIPLNPLGQICMSELEKTELAIQISLKKAFAIDENGIFETLKSGVKVLDKYRQNQDSPQQTLAKIRFSTVGLSSKNERKTDFAVKAETVSFQQFSRPPTAQISAKFDFQIAQNLENISRNINPRSPPFIFS